MLIVWRCVGLPSRIAPRNIVRRGAVGYCKRRCVGLPSRIAPRNVVRRGAVGQRVLEEPSLQPLERERDYTYPALRLIQVLPGHPLADPKDVTVSS